MLLERGGRRIGVCVNAARVRAMCAMAIGPHTQINRNIEAYVRRAGGLKENRWGSQVGDVRD